MQAYCAVNLKASTLNICVDVFQLVHDSVSIYSKYDMEITVTIFLVAGSVTTFHDFLEMSSSIDLNSHIISAIVSPISRLGSWLAQLM